jgi:hypothetical protein
VKSDVAVSGLVGLVLGGFVFLAAYWYKNHIPFLLEGNIGAAIAFLVLLLMALSEMPVMVWALQRMARDAATPRLAVLGTHAFYNCFAAVYAAAFLLLTGKETLAFVLAGLGLLRFVSGVWIR